MVVLARLDVSDERRAGLLETFAPRELERYKSFRHDEHRFRWGTARGTLREVLGSALGVAAARSGRVEPAAWTQGGAPAEDSDRRSAGGRPGQFGAGR